MHVIRPGLSLGLRFKVMHLLFQSLNIAACLSQVVCFNMLCISLFLICIIRFWHASYIFDTHHDMLFHVHRKVLFHHSFDMHWIWVIEFLYALKRFYKFCAFDPFPFFFLINSYNMPCMYPSEILFWPAVPDAFMQYRESLHASL
jgi:hypothetical protein